jgi:ribosomal protein L40E
MKRNPNEVHSTKIGGRYSMFCHKCGTRLVEGANFCQRCGEKVVPVGGELRSKPQESQQTTKDLIIPCVTATGERRFANLSKLAREFARESSGESEDSN